MKKILFILLFIASPVWAQSNNCPSCDQMRYQGQEMADQWQQQAQQDRMQQQQEAQQQQIQQQQNQINQFNAMSPAERMTYGRGF